MGFYKGINPADLWVLSEVRFQNDKSFYEQKKPFIKEKILLPLHALIADLAPEFEALDPLIVTDPRKMISRIRRDTRFTRDKTMYRENIWFSFMHPKAHGQASPVMWFEIEPDGFSRGVGCWGSTPAFMKQYRKYLLSYPGKFSDALKEVTAAGFVPDGEAYKTDRPGEPPEELKACYNKKEVFFMKKTESLKALMSPDLVNILTEEYRAAQPMYRCLADITQSMQTDADGAY